MLAKTLVVICVLILCLLFTSRSAFACACCVDPGFYSISMGKPSDYELGYIGEMRFDTVAQLYESEAGFDAIRGLDDLRKDEELGKSINLTVLESFAGKIWRLNLTANGRSGSLALPMPKTMVRFKVDQHDNATGDEPSLYKELRFKGIVGSGTGIFKSANAKPTSYFLVFQGRGNGCDSAADFTHWRIELDGPKAEYSFFGKLNS